MSDVRRIEPTADSESSEYWAGAARGELLFKRCVVCEEPHWYPRAHCPRCHADDTRWEVASGVGTVYTFTIIRQNNSSAFRDWVPYAIGMIELAEGPRVFALIRGDEIDLRVGAPVRVAFESVGATSLPVFHLATSR